MPSPRKLKSTVSGQPRYRNLRYISLNPCIQGPLRNYKNYRAIRGQLLACFSSIIVIVDQFFQFLIPGFLRRGDAIGGRGRNQRDGNFSVLGAIGHRRRKAGILLKTTMPAACKVCPEVDVAAKGSSVTASWTISLPRGGLSLDLKPAFPRCVGGGTGNYSFSCKLGLVWYNTDSNCCFSSIDILFIIMV